MVATVVRYSESRDQKKTTKISVINHKPTTSNSTPCLTSYSFLLAKLYRDKVVMGNAEFMTFCHLGLQGGSYNVAGQAFGETSVWLAGVTMTGCGVSRKKGVGKGVNRAGLYLKALL